MVRYRWNTVTDSILCEQNDDMQLLATYTQEPGLYGELISQRRDGHTYYHHYDGEGNTRQVTDENENVVETATYSAFGEVVEKTSTIANPFGYKGALGYYANPDANDVYVRVRAYVPVMGRWMSIDPIFFLASDENLYRYVANNPINLADPSGLTAITAYFDAFINVRINDADGWFDEPGGILWEFRGDDRGFGAAGSFRLASFVGIDSCDVGAADPYGTNDTGISHRRLKDPAFPTVYSAKSPLLVDHVAGRHDNICYSRVCVTAKAPYAFKPRSSPSIDYSVCFEFEAGADYVIVSVNGSHDEFPDYEAYVSGPVHKMLYTFPTRFSGPSLVNLNTKVPISRNQGLDGSSKHQRVVLYVPTRCICGGSCP